MVAVTFRKQVRFVAAHHTLSRRFSAARPRFLQSVHSVFGCRPAPRGERRAARKNELTPFCTDTILYPESAADLAEGFVVLIGQSPEQRRQIFRGGIATHGSSICEWISCPIGDCLAPQRSELRNQMILTRAGTWTSL
jgi:hypothetical protein